MNISNQTMKIVTEKKSSNIVKNVKQESQESSNTFENVMKKLTKNSDELKTVKEADANVNEGEEKNDGEQNINVNDIMAMLVSIMQDTSDDKSQADYIVDAVLNMKPGEKVNILEFLSEVQEPQNKLQTVNSEVDTLWGKLSDEIKQNSENLSLFADNISEEANKYTDNYINIMDSLLQDNSKNIGTAQNEITAAKYAQDEASMNVDFVKHDINGNHQNNVNIKFQADQTELKQNVSSDGFAELAKNVELNATKEKIDDITSETIAPSDASKETSDDIINPDLLNNNRGIFNEFEKVIELSDESSKINRGVLNQVEDRIVTMVKDGIQQVEMELNPKNLGKVNIKLSIQEGKLSVEITALNDDSAKILASNSKELLAGLQKSFNDTTVYVNVKDNSSEAYNQNNPNHNQNQNGRNNNNVYDEDIDENSDDMAISEMINFRNMLLNKEIYSEV